MPTAKVKTILERLFRKGGNTRKKLLMLDTAEFCRGYTTAKIHYGFVSILYMPVGRRRKKLT